MNVSSSRIQACFSRTRISAQESELPICPAFALLYMAKKRFFTEKARSSSRTCSSESSARLDRVERLSVTGSSLSYASPARRVPRETAAPGNSSREKIYEQDRPAPTVSPEDLCEKHLSDSLAP